jgi:hypothetical protein
MPSGIVPKKNTVTGYRPTAGEMAIGEIATNTADDALYIKNNAGVVVRMNPTALSVQQIAGRAFAMALLFRR